MAGPCSEEQMMSNNDKIDDLDMNNWLELQEKAKLHENQMKKLITSHVEDQQRSVSAETDTGKSRLGIPIFGSNFWDPHWKWNSDSVFNSEDSSRIFFFKFCC